MSNQLTLWALSSATSLPESADGPTLYDSQIGPTTDPCGPEAVRANPSPPLANSAAPPTSDTSGPSSPDSSTNVSLQSSLASKLRQRLDGNGSPLYALTWKQWDMQSGPPICALRASARRTSDRDCGGGGYAGWATASSRDWKDTTGMSTTGINPDGTERTRLDQLPRQVALVGWMADAERTRPAPGLPATTRRYQGEPEVAGNRDSRRIRLKPGESDHESMEARPSAYNQAWRNADWLFGRDGQWRPVESGTFPLGHGLPARVVRLRGYGNAIVPQVAQAFIEAFIDAIGD